MEKYPQLRPPPAPPPPRPYLLYAALLWALAATAGVAHAMWWNK